LAATLKDAFGAEPQLIKGGGGEFIVTVDGRKIFSKKEVGRFPEHDEIVEAIQEPH
jgi:selT/selW/selH-like putative selenoprotein